MSAQQQVRIVVHGRDPVDRDELARRIRVVFRHVTMAASGEEALRELRGRADVLAVAWDGTTTRDLTIVRRAARAETAPMVVVCSRSQRIGTIVKALDAGADGCVRLDEPEVLRAQLVALARRSQKSGKRVLGQSPLTIDAQALHATLFGAELWLSEVEHRLLVKLARCPGELVPWSVSVRRGEP